MCEVSLKTNKKQVHELLQQEFLWSWLANLRFASGFGGHLSLDLSSSEPSAEVTLFCLCFSSFFPFLGSVSS
jgi:hypothetical protein